MKAALSVWNNRIAPVFDVARRVILVDIDPLLTDFDHNEMLLPPEPDGRKVKRLAELDIDVLVCGAVSRFMETMLINAGIQVIGFVAGNYREIIDALRSGDFQSCDYAMPGCRLPMLVPMKPGITPKEETMNGRGAGRWRQQGAGFGQGMGRGMGLGQGRNSVGGTTLQEGNMGKIAITCEEPTLESRVDPRFGRAAGFLIVDPDSMHVEYIDNGSSQAMAQGAGIQAAETVYRSGAKVVLTGFVGPKAFQALTAAGIQVVQNVENMSVREAVEAYKAGRFQPATAPNRMGHGR